ncbi:GreA/GreB family elongation factor [Thermosediminibacter oceani]|uniref:GreA/GreB family elongation factor n=1 Tax=Thermosediminibacter oceani (strain ATCC BAA-1034 / DSM 16646 / JW/IW-1228P) TaxID=555079 RepID=D9S1G5_THEOJ|nr:GreA/GreB family elongation factor [Thermosediminibacter oceani]ADL07242.1 GreA/GreB family elongation factor [Thermosediminibacter oceani DSM 16646]
MQRTYTLSKTAFEALIKHLADLEAGKSRLIDEHFSNSPREARELEHLLDNYIKFMDEFISSVQQEDTADESFPYVVINSRVQVQDIENDETYNFRVVLPSGNIASDPEIYSVSVLSPVGKSLLLKKPGEKVQVNAPGGMFLYEIKAIYFP